VTGVLFELTSDQRAELLAIARRAIRERVRGLRSPGGPSRDPRLEAVGAAFVTISQRGQLRGCIGYVDPIKPLTEAVAHCAAAAATGDPRFPPVTPEELTRLEIEVSVLSPLRQIGDPSEVQVGTHGLYISQSGRNGLLLPQVASELRWDRETFLRQTCLKAGLPADAWRHGAEIQVFTVDHFTDHTPIESPEG
jgi:AmmeMemoRadiSam system protein A